MKTGWTLVWQDEFDGPEINLEYWSHETGGGGWGNAEWENYTDLPVNSFIEDGKLVIQALKELSGGRPYSSARLITREKVEVEYGRVEARIQVPFGQGIWPAFWMLGNNIFRKAWPTAGEIDIMEHIGREPNTVYATVHGPGYSGGNGIGDSIDLAKPVANDVYIRKAGSHARVKSGMGLPADIQYFLESYECCLQVAEWLEVELHGHWHSTEYEDRKNPQIELPIPQPPAQSNSEGQ